MIGRIAALAGLLLLAGVATAGAAFHFMNVVEVFPGTPSRPDAQYVVLQMYADFQNGVSGHDVDFYDANGVFVGDETFVGNVGSGMSQDKILIATSAAQTLFGVAADLIMDPWILPAGGKLCFEPDQIGGPVDCVAWGAYSVNPDTTVGNPFSPAGLPLGQAMKRRLDIFGDPATLDSGDDTNDCANDFVAGAPVPANNAGVISTYLFADGFEDGTAGAWSGVLP